MTEPDSYSSQNICQIRAGHDKNTASPALFSGSAHSRNFVLSFMERSPVSGKYCIVFWSSFILHTNRAMSPWKQMQCIQWLLGQTTIHTKAGHKPLHSLQPWQVRFSAEIQIISVRRILVRSSLKCINFVYLILLFYFSLNILASESSFQPQSP